MARVTVEDCMKRINNRFAVVILACTRTRMILQGSKPLVPSKNKPGVTALREIAGGKVYFNHEVNDVLKEYIEEQKVFDYY